MNNKSFLIVGLIVFLLTLCGWIFIQNSETINFNNRESDFILNLSEPVLDYEEIGLDKSRYLELLVKTSDNVGTDDPVEERAANSKQGYVIDVRPAGFLWGKLERDPKRFAIISILESNWDDSWLENEYNYSDPIIDVDNNLTGEFKILTERLYRLPLEQFLNTTELDDLKSIEYNDETVREPIVKIVDDVITKFELTDYDALLIEEIKLHGSSGNFTICPSGCDYTSINNFESGEEADLTGTGPAIATITEGFVDTSPVNFNGWTTTADDFIKVFTNGSARHNGVWNASAYTLNITDAIVMNFNEDFIIVDGLQLHVHDTTSNKHLMIGGVIGVGGTYTICNNILDGGESSQVLGFTNSDTDLTLFFYNNVIYGTDRFFFGPMRITVNAAYIYGNTMTTNGGVNHIFRHGGGDVYLKNNIAQGSTSNDYVSDIGFNESRNFNNIASDDTVTGSNSFNNTDVVFVDAANDNYNLNESSITARDNGTDLSNDEFFNLTTDIRGVSRPQGSAFDIGAFELIVSVGDVPPTFSNIAVNSTVAGQATNFSIIWDDDVSLNPNGQYIFSTNNTGVWVNDSAINFTSTPSSANVIKTLNSTEGLSIGYRWFATDNASNSNDTGIQVLTTTGVDTCTYVSGDWNILCSDNCVISSPVDIGGNDISIIGTGTFLTTVDISNYNLLHIEGTDATNRCIVRCSGGCFVN